MTKFCTTLFFLFFSLSCAKKIKNNEVSTPSRQLASSEFTKSISVKSDEQKAIKFEKQSFVKIPKTLKVESNQDSYGHEARIYFDYSGKNSDYAYFCVYIPKEQQFSFSGCYYDNSQNHNSQASYNPGYSERIFEDNYIVVEVINLENIPPIEAVATFEVELN